MSGTVGSHFGSTNICKAQVTSFNIASPRQHYSSSIYQQPRWDSVQRASSASQKSLDEVSGTEHSPISSTFTWKEKCCGRHAKPGDDRSIRLEAPSIHFPQNRSIVRSSGSGSIRIQTDIPDSSLLQLVFRSRSGRDSCFSSGLDFKEGLCKSERPTGQDVVLCSSSVSSNHSDCTCLEVPAMVLLPLGDGNRLPQVAS